MVRVEYGVRWIKLTCRKMLSAYRENSVLKRSYIVLFAAALYCLFGIFESMPYAVFQLLLLIEGYGFLRYAHRSKIKYQYYAIVILLLLIAICAEIPDRVNIAGISIFFLIYEIGYIAVVFLTLWVASLKKRLYYNKGCYSLVMVLGSVTILVLLLSFFAIGTVYKYFVLPQVFYSIGEVYITLSRFSVMEILIHITILLSILLQSNEKYNQKYHKKVGSVDK